MRNLKVIFEDNHLIAINKPNGVLVQGDETGDRPISDEVKFYIKHRYNKPGDVFLGVIHRLDRPVSGVLIFGRTSKGLSRMNELFQKKEIKKTYYAISPRRPKELSGTIENYLWKDRNKNKVRLLDKPSNRAADAKKVITHYELMGGMEGNYLIKVTPETGRSHQIRAHMESIGASIKGDLKYGAQHKIADRNILLHCAEMSFMHPIKKEKVSIKAKIPNNQEWNRFRELLEG